jgi:hypothetical protein
VQLSDVIGYVGVGGYCQHSCEVPNQGTETSGNESTEVGKKPTSTWDRYANHGVPNKHQCGSWLKLKRADRPRRRCRATHNGVVHVAGGTIALRCG